MQAHQNTLAGMKEVENTGKMPAMASQVPATMESEGDDLFQKLKNTNKRATAQESPADLNGSLERFFEKSAGKTQQRLDR